MSNRPLLLLTNDDGIEAVGMKLLVQQLEALDKYRILVIAPRKNQSATGMRLNLMKPLALRNRNDLIEQWNLNPASEINLFDIEGTPCDCMIIALDGGLEYLVQGQIPTMVVSGVNLGPNMSQDCLHSGTMGAAREAAMYGLPAISSSLTVFDDLNMDVAVKATVEAVNSIVQHLPLSARNHTRPQHDSMPWHWGGDVVKANDDMLQNAFLDGDVYLNLNIPPSWNGQWKSTRLGIRWYKNAVSFERGVEETMATFTIGASLIEKSDVISGDCDAVELDFASISALSTWPQNHPLSMSERVLTYAYESHHDFPKWLNFQDKRFNISSRSKIK
ncbi:MAG: hypothetical protein O2866_02430 [archaeon]|nr:hypothetical protein [archaeon]MDA0842643.1 hypothetical protein [archaeon]MDA1167721.1 hypothetical protein [archaeon]